MSNSTDERPELSADEQHFVERVAENFEPDPPSGLSCDDRPSCP